MKNCLIYGHNGLDLDVTMNLRSFYKSLGFKVIFSENLHQADLLVVLRAVSNPINLTKYKFSLIHIFDYVGWDYNQLLKSIKHDITFIYCTNPIKQQGIIDNCGFPKEHIFVVLPPVDTNLWSSKIEKKEYEFVHIGNFKKIEEGDITRKRFLKILIEWNVNVWGINWKGVGILKKLYHGKLGLFNVSKIYLKSKFALGLMYPFQRHVTFSGRFWQAPLNGCYVFSEAGYYTKSIPGIIETDYTAQDFKGKSLLQTDSIALQKEAKQFWDDQYKFTLSYISPTLNLIKASKFDIKIYCNFMGKYLLNFLRIYYQKMSLFLLFK